MIAKTRIHNIVFLFCVLVMAFAYMGNSSIAAENTYVYEKKDEAAEQTEFLFKLNEDNKKVDMAILNTKTLIDRSRGRVPVFLFRFRAPVPCRESAAPFRHLL